MLEKAFMMALGVAMMVMAALVPTRRGKLRDTALAMGIYAIGAVYFLMGLYAVEDPELTWEALGTIFGILGGCFTVGKMAIWAFTKTQFYQKLDAALTAMTRLNEVADDLKEIKKLCQTTKHT